MLLAKMEDDTGFIITLGVVLLAVICWLVLGQDQTIRLEDAEDVLGSKRERARIDGDVRPVAVTYRNADRWRNHEKL